MQLYDLITTMPVSLLQLLLIIINNNMYLRSNIQSTWRYEFSGLLQHTFTIINSDHNINNNNIYIVVYSQHPYCYVNNIVLTLFLKQSKFDVLICSLNLFNSHGAA